MIESCQDIFGNLFTWFAGPEQLDPLTVTGAPSSDASWQGLPMLFLDEWWASAVSDAAGAWAPLVGLGKDDAAKKAVRQCSTASFFFGASAALDATGVTGLVRLGAGAVRLGANTVADALQVGYEVYERYLVDNIVLHPQGFQVGVALGYAQQQITGRAVSGAEVLLPFVGTLRAGGDVRAACGN